MKLKLNLDRAGKGNSLSSEIYDDEGTVNNSEVVIENESKNLILTFSLYDPKSHVKQEELDVLGSQTLLDLHEKIYCVYNVIHHEGKQLFII